MILIAQRFFSRQHAEAIVMVPAEKPYQWDLGVLTYDPSTTALTAADPGQARFLGTADVLGAFRAALGEMTLWALPETEVVTLAGFIARLEAFLGQLAAGAANPSVLV